MKNALIIILGLLALAGCSNGTGGKDAPGPQVTVQGKSPSEYDNQFLYRCTDEKESPSEYCKFASNESLLIGRTLEEKDVRLDADLFLFADGTFTMNYYEQAVVEYVQNGYSYDIHFRKQIIGTWQVSSDGTIALSGLGFGTPLESNKAPAILFKFDIDIHQPNLAGREAVFRIASSWGKLPDLK